MKRYGWIAVFVSLCFLGCLGETGTTPWAFGNGKDATVADADSNTRVGREFCPDCQWMQFIGGAKRESANAIAVGPNGRVMVAGGTLSSNLEGQKSEGDAEAFVAAHDRSGKRQWLRLLGGPNRDGATDVATDAKGNVYLAGVTQAGVGTSTDDSASDAFIAKYDASGERRWERSVGNDRRAEVGGSVTVDNDGGVYFVGSARAGTFGRTDANTRVVFVTRYSQTGDRKWVRLIENPSDQVTQGTSVTTFGSGSVLVTGYMRNEVENRDESDWNDAFVARFSAKGKRHWLEFLRRPSPDSSRAIASGGDEQIYIAGYTSRDLGPSDKPQEAFVAQYGGNGKRRWVRRLKSAADDEAHGAATDPEGGLRVVGSTSGDPAGQKNGEPDTRVGNRMAGFLAEYTPSGERQRVRLLQTTEYDEATDVAVDDAGRVFVVGNTSGNLHGWTNKGGYDTFVAAFDK